MQKIQIKFNTVDSLETGEDVKTALSQLTFERYYSHDIIDGCIRDIKGNTIGSWMVVEK